MVEAGTDSVSVLRQDCLVCVKNSEVAGAAGVGGGVVRAEGQWNRSLRGGSSHSYKRRG